MWWTSSSESLRVCACYPITLHWKPLHCRAGEDLWNGSYSVCQCMRGPGLPSLGWCVHSTAPRCRILEQACALLVSDRSVNKILELKATPCRAQRLSGHWLHLYQKKSLFILGLKQKISRAYFWSVKRKQNSNWMFQQVKLKCWFCNNHQKGCVIVCTFTKH